MSEKNNNILMTTHYIADINYSVSINDLNKIKNIHCILCVSISGVFGVPKVECVIKMSLTINK